MSVAAPRQTPLNQAAAGAWLMQIEDDARDSIDAFGASVATPIEVRTAFSWAGFAGGLAALTWIGAAVAGALSYFGPEAALATSPLMQAGFVALAFGPALLFWVAASAAAEALKTRRLAVQLTRFAHEARAPLEAGSEQAQHLGQVVKLEIEGLNEAVANALDQLSELDISAQRNSALFNEAVSSSRADTEAMGGALARERDAMAELGDDLRNQGEQIAGSIARQVRLVRESSRLVKTEFAAAEVALDSRLAAFAASSAAIGEQTAAFQDVVGEAADAATALNATLAGMLDGLSEATRLTDAARQSAKQAIIAANETASALRETTRSAIAEAKQAAQQIRAETAAMQAAAVDTLAQARAAPQGASGAASRHAASIQPRLATPAVGAVKKSAARAPAPQAPPANDCAPIASLHAAAAIARSTPRPHVSTACRAAKTSAGGWNNFVQQLRGAEPLKADNNNFSFVDFAAPNDPDSALKLGVVDLVADAGVDLADVLHTADLAHIARSSRSGPAARRRAVLDAAPGAVGRIARHVHRHGDAQDLAARFRARPDLAKSANNNEDSELVRAYLLIDAALA